MGALQVLLATLVCLDATQITFCLSPVAQIVNYATSQKDSQKWASETSDQSGMFINSVIGHVGMQMPGHIWLLGSVFVSAAEWSNPAHHKTACYKLCTGDPILGDFLAEKNHVAIVTGDHLTTGPALDATPRGTVKETDWGFRSGQNATCWRYGGLDFCNHLLKIFG